MMVYLKLTLSGSQKVDALVGWSTGICYDPTQVASDSFIPSQNTLQVYLNEEVGGDSSCTSMCRRRILIVPIERLDCILAFLRKIGVWVNVVGSSFK